MTQEIFTIDPPDFVTVSVFFKEPHEPMFEASEYSAELSPGSCSRSLAPHDQEIIIEMAETQLENRGLMVIDVLIEDALASKEYRVIKVPGDKQATLSENKG